MSDIEIAINKMHESIDKFERERQEHLDSIKDSLAPIESDAFTGPAPGGAVDWNEVADKLVHPTDMVPASGQIFEEVEPFPETFNMDAWEPVDTPIDPITVDPITIDPVDIFVDPIVVDPVDIFVDPIMVDPIVVDPISVDPITVDPVDIEIDDQIWMEPTIADSTKIEEDILGVEEDSLRVSKDILSTLKKGSGALT